MSPRAANVRAGETTVSLEAEAGVAPALIRRWVTDARRRLRLRGGIAVAVVGPGTSRRLNRTYRRKDKPTNVLTFLGEPGSGELGDIVLCPAVIRREAAAQARPYRDHLQFILQHGCIHLLGLDHRTAAEQRRWTQYERRLA